MAGSRSLISVGLDVGTTTTQIVFSRLTLGDAAQAGQVPRITIREREVLYRSPIAFTPLAGSETIDVQRLTALVRREYANAQIAPEEVETGAVIITGETAKKHNAAQILEAMAGLAGEFVVTVAGPYLEALIAGRGSGAAQVAQQRFRKVTNVDLGGGSANVAVFHAAKMAGAAAMNFGGRILEVEKATGRVKHVAQPARAILGHLELRLDVGDMPELDVLRRFAGVMANLTHELIEGRSSALATQLYLTAPLPISAYGSQLMFSGGVGHYYYEPAPVSTVAEVAVHGDIGPLLADELRHHTGLQAYDIARPAETLRATVLGASTQTISLSGSTIWAEKEFLPLRNVPVVHLALDDTELTPEAVVSGLREAVRRWDLTTEHDLFAVALDFERALDYTALTRLSQGLSAFAQKMPPERPLVVVVARDYAQALGQTVKGLDARRPLLVIDQVGLEEGDYIDIGTPLMDGRVVPLSVKTLVFHS